MYQDQKRISDVPHYKLSGFTITDSGCWEYPIISRRLGYGIVSVGHSERYYAHRVFYHFFKGELIDGLTIDHLCRNRQCCNPDHLEQVSAAENKRRGYCPAMINRRKTSCPKCNSDYTLKKNGKRYCKPCFNIWQNKRYKEARQV